MNLGESDWLLIQKECSNLAKKARISGFRLWIIPELSILLLKIAGSGYEIACLYGFPRVLSTQSFARPMYSRNLDLCLFVKMSEK